MAIIELVSVDDLAVYATTMQAVAISFRGKTGEINKTAIRRMSIQAEKNFRKSILRPETSKTLGGQTYRAGGGSSAVRGSGGRFTGSVKASRVSGKFTFGAGKTFTGSLIKEGANVTGFGYPISARADKRTKGVWRGLEFGWDSMRMPFKGQWRNADGERMKTSRSAGGDAFFPAGPSNKEVKGIKEKLFITKAFNTVVKTYVEPGYRKAAEAAAREATNKS